MKKASLIFLLGILVACNNSGDVPESAHPTDHTEVEPPKRDTNRLEVPADTTRNGRSTQNPQAYSNERFENVQVTKKTAQSYQVTGKVQVFEARFGWEVKNNQQQLANGFESADAGAPAWGNFSFRFALPDGHPAAPLRLILFVESPKNGSRQNNLVIPLA